jgi:hypothetical protein
MTLPRTSLVKRDKGFFHYELAPTRVSGYFNYIAAITQYGGQGCAVTRTGLADYLITMDDQDITSIRSCVCTIQSAGTTDLDCCVDTITMGPPTTIQVHTLAAGALTDLTATENCHFDITYIQSATNLPETHQLGYFHEVPDVTKIAGNFAITGAVGAVGAINCTGLDATAPVVRTAQGIYTLTFQDGFAGIVSGTCNCGGAGAVDVIAQFGAFTPGAAGATTLVIRTKTTAGQVNPPDTSRITFDLNLYSNSTDP